MEKRFFCKGLLSRKTVFQAADLCIDTKLREFDNSIGLAGKKEE